MQYFLWHGQLCRLWRDDAQAMKAECWDAALSDYGIASPAAILRDGETLSRDEAMAFMRTAREAGR